ncbi:MAG: 50S ribosomal protein L23 [Candidatus Nanohalarchaeota archaeon]|nr:MAG: 50S ribosomal protein L23 [Candidatus Nanohaloarchaeota archaeon]
MTDKKEPESVKKEQDKEPKTETTTSSEEKHAETPQTTKDKEPEKTKKEKSAKAKEKKQEPKQAQKETPKGNWDLLKFPHLSEKSIANIELQNKIVFIVKSSSKRTEIKKAVETMFDVKVEKVNMLTTTKGHKKALVRLKPDYSALDIATRLGMM